MLTWSAKWHSKSSDYLGILGMILEPKDVGTLLHKVFKICCAAVHALVCEVPKPFLQITMQADWKHKCANGTCGSRVFCVTDQEALGVMSSQLAAAPRCCVWTIERCSPRLVAHLQMHVDQQEMHVDQHRNGCWLWAV